MAQPPNDEPGDVQTTGHDEWYTRVAQTVEERGFAYAWEKHFVEIVQAHHSSSFSDRLLGLWPFRWLGSCGASGRRTTWTGRPPSAIPRPSG